MCIAVTVSEDMMCLLEVCGLCGVTMPKGRATQKGHAGRGRERKQRLAGSP